MYKNYRYFNAGDNEIHRWGHKAVDKVLSWVNPKNGWVSIPVNGGKYWTIGTSEGKYGEFCNINGTLYSVNRGGFAYAKADTEKGQKLTAAIKAMAKAMEKIHYGEDYTDED